MKKGFLVLLVVCLLAVFFAGCNDAGGGSEPEVIPDSEIAGYVADLTDASFTLIISVGDEESAIDGKVKKNRAEITYSDGEDTTRSVYILDGGFSYGYLIADEGAVLCEKVPYATGSTEPTDENGEEEIEETYRLSDFLDRAEKGVQEHTRGFSWKKYLANVDDKMKIEYESGNYTVVGAVRVGAGNMGTETYDKPSFIEATADDVDGYDHCSVYACAEIDGEIAVALSYLFDGEKARLDILFQAFGVWFRQVNYLVKEGDRLYFYSQEEEWQYTDLYAAFTPSAVVKTTAELLLIINDLRLSDAFGANGYYCAMDGEPGIFRCYFSESDETVVFPEEMNSSKDRAERIVNY